MNGTGSATLPRSGAANAKPAKPRADGPDDRLLLHRFVRHSDAAAFEKLVHRHGPMVLGVCQRVLGNTHDADDAFQATFLVLMRKAPSLRRPDLLGNWLYGVAYRTAHKARAQAARRRRLERQVAAPAGVQPPDEAAREFNARLAAELQLLPEPYRAPLVLCYLEGLTNAQAARRLGWPTGSISYRLARGRALLRARTSAS
jgi:RNA polymerase sigma factor (sigma-70 family)